MMDNNFVCNNEDALRIIDEVKDIREPFSRDIDRILYSDSYTKLAGKTQVHPVDVSCGITTRMIHVNYVSRIARSIARGLSLNEDLVEAGALAHDVGHVAFGHDGERALNDVTKSNGLGYFKHNVHSARALMYIENQGSGLNLNYQVLDAALCHNGEILDNEYVPKGKSILEFMDEYNRCYSEKVNLRSSTLEGCVVRISDIIAYIGKDIEDAIKLGIVDQDYIPESIGSVLGYTNREIINTIVLDIINNSMGKCYIKLSPIVFDAIFNLKKLNYKKIYDFSSSRNRLGELKKEFMEVFSILLNELDAMSVDSSVVSFYNKMDCEYRKNSFERVVVDYMASLSEKEFVRVYQKNK